MQLKLPTTTADDLHRGSTQEFIGKTRKKDGLDARKRRVMIKTMSVITCWVQVWQTCSTTLLILTTSKFLGVDAEAEVEEIKSAYRRLSKEYHPDTTSLPLKVASEKFMKLKQVYEVLSNEESRKFYDWTLAQEEASRQADKLRMKLEDPYEQELQNWVSTPDMVDRLGGRNLELSDQASTALTLDIFIILFAIACIVYVLLFKEPYY
ncbi:NAD(P)H-quinone oxidoreductase subunit T, chloroplastic isoform X2 [Cucumis sativus]|uniref:NAD(P)H-quinone oxidoreductase subunit T, chloroplastic isoform X2 n=1 Tax=Cucumis sativus TaxID=3659 RepID=UPI0005EC7975|nr:NAD(P)H-quinone oxidoreductase subunit T, chloroplastic isoform X2 [Cucumis sativus]